VSRPALGPTEPPAQWVPGALAPAIEWPEREVDHTLPSSAKFGNEQNYISTPTICLHGEHRTTAASYTEMWHYHALGCRIRTDNALWFKTHYSALGYRVPTGSAPWFRTHYSVLGCRVRTDSAPWLKTHYSALGCKVRTDSAPWFKTHYSALGYRSKLTVHRDSENTKVR